MSSKLSAASQPRTERKRTIKYHVVDLRLDRHALRYAKNWKQVKQYQATPDGRAKCASGRSGDGQRQGGESGVPGAGARARIATLG